MDKKFRWKVFISISLTISFFIIFFTGIILYLAPPGRVANWSHWKIIGLEKSEWQALHIIFSYTFAILSIFHLFTINWKVFWSYIVSKTQKTMNRKTEIITAILFMALFFTGSRMLFPPFSTVIDFGETLTDSWENKNNDIAPPIPHTETYPLDELAGSILNIPLDSVISTLLSEGYDVKNTSVTLKDLGEKYDVSPQSLFELFNKNNGENKVVNQPDSINLKTRGYENDETHVPTGQGMGYGRMTLSGVANNLGVDASVLIEKLEKQNIKARKNDNLKSIASDAGVTPAEIYEILNN